MHGWACCCRRLAEPDLAQVQPGRGGSGTPASAPWAGRQQIPLGAGLLIGLVLVTAAAVKTRFAAGAGPHDEEFIPRQKAGGLLGRFTKLPVDDST